MKMASSVLSAMRFHKGPGQKTEHSPLLQAGMCLAIFMDDRDSGGKGLGR